MAETSLTRTFTTDNSNVYKWTYSVWVKRSGLGADQAITAPTASGTIQGRILFRSDDRLEVYDYRNGYILQKKTNRQFRDTSAWYHIVVSNDNSVSSPDTKIYINGVEETSFTIDNEYPQNETNTFNSNIANYIGTYSTGDYFSGSMSHFHFIDGTAYDASAFGETDATTGEWKGKTSPSVTYGTNGFFILKDGNGITDQSGEGNNWTVGGGTLTDLKDNPDNVFATLNSLHKIDDWSLANGNTVFTNISSGYRMANSTIAGYSGKFYGEVKINTVGGSQSIGVIDPDNFSFNTYFHNAGRGYGYKSNDGTISFNDGTLNASYGSSYTTGDIIGIAMDLDNYKLYFSKNGVWQNSGDPTSGATGTGSAANLATGVAYSFGQSTQDAGTNPVASWNFGNGYFGTTAITTNSGNGYAGAEGSSKFNYTVPTGYSALNTKGLNE